MDAKHTPGPWTVGIYPWLITDESDTRVAQVDANNPAFKANAEFIVRAVNNYGQMRAALEAARQFIRNGVEFGYIRMPDADTPDRARDTLPMIEAALAAGER